MLTICYLPPKPGHIKKHIIFTTPVGLDHPYRRANFGSNHGTILWFGKQSVCDILINMAIEI